MRNEVRPAQNTSVLTVDRPGRNTVDTQKELQLLRMEIRRMKNECKCLVGHLVIKGTRCLGSDELVFEKRLKPFVMKCIMVRKMF